MNKRNQLDRLKIKKISSFERKLCEAQDKFFELWNGLVYRKHKNNLLFYVLDSMEDSVIRTAHEVMGVEKTSEVVLWTFWFPNLRERIKNFILNCLKCITYSLVYGKKEYIAP